MAESAISTNAAASTAATTTDKAKGLLTPKRIVAGVITIVALLFVFQNTGTGSFHFLFFEFKAPRWLWLLGVFAAGFGSGVLFTHRRAHATS
jgi:uncharacterized integral membrane protein